MKPEALFQYVFGLGGSCLFAVCAYGQGELVSEPAAASAYPRFEASLFNSAYAYNGENGAWDKTRVTLTYFENLFEPKIRLRLKPSLSFTVGAGLLIPFNQEQKVQKYFPYVQSKFEFQGGVLTLGSLDVPHDFPAPVLDPLASLTPRIRLNDANQIPIPYETFPEGIHSHGRYEYGVSLAWPDTWGKGELYLNWQLPDTAQHRERFDAGLIHSFSTAIPWYLAVHYWHNGGHENPHPVEVTENYVVAAGLRTADFSALYLASLFLPDRSRSALNVFGQGLFFEARLPWGNWVFTPQAFLSEEYFGSKAHRFISIEGDPFYRVPLYLGLNISRDWELWRQVQLRLAFVNGIYLPDKGSKMILRYDQMLRFNLVYDWNL